MGRGELDPLVSAVLVFYVFQPVGEEEEEGLSPVLVVPLDPSLYRLGVCEQHTSLQLLLLFPQQYFIRISWQYLQAMSRTFYRANTGHFGVAHSIEQTQGTLGSSQVWL